MDMFDGATNGGWIRGKGPSTMWFLKACPRCHGDLVFDEDREGAFLLCIQCGHVLSAAQEQALGVRVDQHGVSPLAVHARRAKERERQPVTAAR